jgi:6-phosphogluconolactonase (cycloisomerase 2 family)
MPVSVDVDRRSVYVLHAGGDAPNGPACDLHGRGGLNPRATAPLAPGASGAAQVSVSPDRRALVVTERGANRIETFPLRFGRPGTPVVTASSGAVPFGFAFSPRGDLVVSEAGASTVSSYRLARDLTATPVTASLAVGQGAACWVAITRDGRYAYTGNATGSISGFAIGRDGALTALNADGLTALAPRPNDLAIAGDFLYAVNSFTGQVTAYRIGTDGSLTELPRMDSLGTTLAGLAAR